VGRGKVADLAVPKCDQERHVSDGSKSECRKFETCSRFQISDQATQCVGACVLTSASLFTSGPNMHEPSIIAEYVHCYVFTAAPTRFQTFKWRSLHKLDSELSIVYLSC